MAKKDWRRVSRQQPCQFCGGFDNCSESADGGAAYCGRIENGSISQNAGGQFLHLLRDREQRRGEVGDYEHPSHRRERVGAEANPVAPHSSLDWDALARLCQQHPHATRRRAELAVSLGVSVVALERLRVGCGTTANNAFWTFPERNARGEIIGITRRFETPINGKNKLLWKGGNRGLSYEDDWSDGDGPIYLVEGASDTAAGLSMGLSVIGRPSNTGGIQHLVELLADVPHHREIVAMGENDQKPHESLSDSVKLRHKPDCNGCSICWPGQYGAFTTATRLADELRRPVWTAFPSDGAKDLREMVRMLEGVA